MGRISETTTAMLHGTTIKAQCAARKAAPDSGIDAMHASDELIVAQAANAVKGGVKQIDKGSQLIEDLRIASVAKGFQVKKARKFTDSEINTEAGPGASPEARIAAVLRLQRRAQ